MVDQHNAAPNLNYAKLPYDFGRVLSRTYKGLFSVWKPVSLAIGSVILLNLAISMLYLPFESAGSSGSQTTAGIAHILVLAIALPVTVLGYIFVMIVTDAAIFSKSNNKLVTFSELAQKALQKCVPLCLGLILFIIAYCIGLFFVIIPGLIIFYGWGIFGPIYVNEDIGLFSSFGRAWNLISGYKWWYFLTTFVSGLINTIFLGVVFSLVILPFSYGFNFEAGGSVMSTTLEGLFFTTIVSICIYLYVAVTAAMTTAVYLEVKSLKEGAGQDNLADIFA